ncbi:MAG: UPF0280 family protein [Anderseniella sp.]|jgi:ApbE superfamily uncharacterized protein (UPF0280 family)|nr:UPF0280 family protein [Anderseniella sp.]
MSIQAAMLPDGKRLHLQHGPIDLIIWADGEPAQVDRAYIAARSRFDGLLEQLICELAVLRTEMPLHGLPLAGPVARRMGQAVQPYWREQATPMAAVAGAVADQILHAMLKAASLRRAYVNNGGDIALHLAHGQSFSIASANGHVAVTAADGVGGIATSGWRGRSHSLGIADSVTVLARSAARADVAATLIANAVDLPGSPKITRLPACELNPDSDLRNRLATVDVAALTAAEAAAALARGVQKAREFQRRGLIIACTLGLNDKVEQLVPAPVIDRTPAHA